MSNWTEDWTIESVENNYKVLGCIDPEDVKQLISDAKALKSAEDQLFNAMVLLVEAGDMIKLLVKELQK
jgi:hypothetical protein